MQVNRSVQLEHRRSSEMEWLDSRDLGHAILLGELFGLRFESCSNPPRLWAANKLRSQRISEAE
jgi:hypothetical protein